MEQLWSMYNKADKLRIDDLKMEHVRIILLAIPNSRMKDWYACREGDLHWYPISELPEFYEDVRALKGAEASGGPEVPFEEGAESEEQTKSILKPKKAKTKPGRALFEDAPAGELKTNSKLSMMKTSIKERRTAQRYPRHVHVKVTFGGKVFECFSEDISMTGLSLKAPLPDWVPETFRASLNYKETLVRVHCKKVSVTKVKIVEADSWDVIRKWIVSG